MSLQKLSWSAVGLCCVAALLQPFIATRVVLYVFVGLIVVADVLLLIGVTTAQRQYIEMDEALTLQEQWRTQRERTR